MTVMLMLGDCRHELTKLRSGSIHTCVTSPPYFGLRDYGTPDQMGLEATPDAFVAELVDVFREVRRVLRDDGTLWLNLGDSYAGSGKGRMGDGTHYHDPESKQATSAGTINGLLVKTNAGLATKQLIGIPWRVAFALQADGWYLRQDIIWSKPNPMPESVTDRCTKSHEYIFLLSKSPRYYFDSEAIKEPIADPSRAGKLAGGNGRKDAAFKQAHGDNHRGALGGIITETRNRRSVWTVSTKPFKGAHFATFPPDLIEPCILAGCPVGGTVLDPFGGAGTTALVAERHGRNSVLCELNFDYAAITCERLGNVFGWLPEVVQPPIVAVSDVVPMPVSGVTS